MVVANMQLPVSTQVDVFSLNNSGCKLMLVHPFQHKLPFLCHLLSNG
jgi:hypothetical protein